VNWQRLSLVASAFCSVVLLTAGGGGRAAETVKSAEQFATGKGLIADRASLPGAKIFAENCAFCHNGSVPKAPHLQWLEMLQPQAVVDAMTKGVMREQAAALSPDDKLRVAEYITRVDLRDGLPKISLPPMCKDGAAGFDRSRPVVAAGWGHDTRRYVAAAQAGLSGDDLKRLELKWSYAFPNASKARSQPSIGLGAVFVGSEDGRVYAFDLKTGCAKWIYQAAGEVRTGVVLVDGPTPSVYFGDILGRLYAVDALTGKERWSKRLDEHPSATITATPLYHDGRIYAPVSSLEVVPAADPNYPCCTFRGSMVALDAQDGREVWRFWAIPERPRLLGKTAAGADIYGPSGAPMWLSPTLDAARGLIYAGTGENYSSPADENSDSIFAIDIASGKRVWHRQTITGDAWNVACMMADNPNCPTEKGPDFDHSSSPLLVDLPVGKPLLLVGHKNGTVYALDPDKAGALLWQVKVGRGSIQGGVHFGMAVEGTTLYVPINDMNNLRDGKVMDAAAARPGMHAVDIVTGKLLWSRVQANVCGPDRPFCDPGISAAVTALPGAVVAGHLDGHVRAYARKDGALLWDFDTVRDFVGVNGMHGRGGGMSGAGAAIGDGHIVINSGYGLYFHEPGNMLLVFGPADKAR